VHNEDESMQKGWTVFLALMVLLPLGSQAQPLLNFKRITVNWPTIELYFTVSCEGKPVYDVGKEPIRIRENGLGISNFTLWCPDPQVRAANSVSLVVDVSGSMRGLALTEAQNIINTWSLLMDGVMDEAAVITSGSRSAVALSMTSDTARLREAVQQLGVGGSSGLFNGIHHGIEHLKRNAYNPCRAVIVFSDGRDNASTMTAAEVIAFANSERVRVFTVGTGLVVDRIQLEMIALLTGGYYLEHPSAGRLVSLYQELNCIMYPGYQECVVTYEHTGCADGSMRTVEFQLQGVCEGGDSKSRTYRAPRDTTDFVIQQLRIGNVVSEPAAVVTVPLLLDWLPPDSTLHPFAATIVTGENRRQLIAARIPPGSPFDGAALQMDVYPDSLRLELLETCRVREAGPLIELQFSTAGVIDSAFYPLEAIFRATPERCILNLIRPGGYSIIPNLQPRISPAGEVYTCPGGISLTANEGFRSYHWSTGDTSRSIRAQREGAYYVDVVNARGDTLRSAATVVHILPSRDIRVEAEGPLEVCGGESVLLRVAGDVGTDTVYWNGIWKRQELEVGSTGRYWAEITDTSGCRSSSDTVLVTVRRPPVSLNSSGNIMACPYDTLELRVLQSYPEYHWSTGETTQSIRIVATPERYARNYAVWVRDSAGCRSTDHYVFVNAHRERNLELLPAKHLLHCGQGEITLTPLEEFTSWRWSTGDTTRALIARAPGSYTLTATDSNGCSVSSTAVVEDISSVPRPTIRAQGYRLCAGESIILDGGEEYAAWRWSTGDTTRFLVVERTGSYFADVTAFGGCTRRTDTVLIGEEHVPQIAISPSRDTVICAGDSLRLSAPAGYAQYLWSTGETAASIFVREAGSYAVSVVSAGGCENTSPPLHITLLEAYPPDIRHNGRLLYTYSRADSYQWYRDGIPIAGATSSSFMATQTGRYAVEIVDSCGRHLRSMEVLVTVNPVELPVSESPRVEMYPDPVTDVLRLEAEGMHGETDLEIHDVLGRRVHAERLPGNGVYTIDLSALKTGFYVLRLRQHGHVIVRKLRMR
jgi:hypothetical protein